MDVERSICPWCGGTGGTECSGGVMFCRHCHGSGELAGDVPDDDGWDDDE